MAEYTYTKAANVPLLREEIEAESAITTDLDFIYVDGTDLRINFVSTLDSGEETALDAVVAAHTGTPSIEPGVDEPPADGVDEDDPAATGNVVHDRQHVAATSQVQTNCESYVDLDSMTLTTRDFGDSVPGSYQIWFTCIFDMNSDNETGDFRLLIDGAEKASGSFNVEDDGGFGQVAVLHHQEADLIDGKVIKIQFKTSDDDVPVKVVRRSLMIDGITQARVLTS